MRRRRGARSRGHTPSHSVPTRRCLSCSVRCRCPAATPGRWTSSHARMLMIARRYKHRRLGDHGDGSECDGRAARGDYRPAHAARPRARPFSGREPGTGSSGRGVADGDRTGRHGARQQPPFVRRLRGRGAKIRDACPSAWRDGAVAVAASLRARLLLASCARSVCVRAHRRHDRAARGGRHAQGRGASAATMVATGGCTITCADSSQCRGNRYAEAETELTQAVWTQSEGMGPYDRRVGEGASGPRPATRRDRNAPYRIRDPAQRDGTVCARERARLLDGADVRAGRSAGQRTGLRGVCPESVARRRSRDPSPARAVAVTGRSATASTRRP